MGRGPGQVGVGSWIKVYWDGDDTWYNAEVTEFDPVTKWCKVLYEDGEREDFRLSDVEYKKIKGGKLREGDDEDAGRVFKKRLRYIHHTLVDMADRLPEFAVRKDSRQWWEQWQENVRKAAHSRSLTGLMKLAAGFGEQISVFGIEGKVDVTTAWWKSQVRKLRWMRAPGKRLVLLVTTLIKSALQSVDWQAKLKEAKNYEDVASRVKDLLLRAVDWTAARNLFTSTDLKTGGAPVKATREEDSMRKELKRKEPVSETITPALVDRRLLSAEGNDVSETARIGKRRKVTKRMLGEVTWGTRRTEKEATQGKQRREEEVSSKSPSAVEVRGPLKVRKKKRVENKAEGESVVVEVQENFGIPKSSNLFYSVPVSNHFSPSDIPFRGSETIRRCTLFEERQEVQVPISQSERLASGTFFCETVVAGKRKRVRKKKKLQDAGKLGTGNLGKTFFFAEAHLIKRSKRGRKKKLQPVACVVDALHFVDEGITCRVDASSSNMQEQPQLIELQNAQEGDHHGRNGPSMRKIASNANEDPENSTYIVKGTENVPQATASKTRSEVRRKRGRPRKVALEQVDFGISVEAPKQADLDQPRPLSLEAAEVEEKQQTGLVTREVDRILVVTLQGDSPVESNKTVTGREKDVQRRKRGRPRKVLTSPVLESQSNGNIVSHRVESTSQCKVAVTIVDGVEPVKRRKRGRPRKSVPLQTLDSPQHVRSLGEENGEPAPQSMLLSAIIQAPDDADVISTGQEVADLVSNGEVDQMKSKEDLAYAARTKVDVVADGPIISQSTPTPKKRGRPRKISVPVEYLTEYVRDHEGSPPHSSPCLSSVSKECHNKNEVLVSYKRRIRNLQITAVSSRTCQAETAGEEENSQSKAAAVAGLHFYQKVAQNPFTPVLMSSLSEEEQSKTAVGTSSTGLCPVVLEDTLINSSKPVAAEDTERTYSRRHFRKSPGRPPRKVIQDKRQESSTSASFSQSAAKPVYPVNSEGMSQTPWKEVPLTSGKDIGTELREKLFGRSALAVLVEEQESQTPNGSDVGKVENAATCPLLNGGVSTAINESPGRSKRLNAVSRSHEPQASHISRQDVGCAVVPSSFGGNLQHDGNMIVANETEVVITNQTQHGDDTYEILELKTGLRQGEEERIASTEDVVKDGLAIEDGQPVHRMDPILIMAPTTGQDTESTLGPTEIQLDQREQVAIDGIQTRETPAVKIFEPSSQSQADTQVLAPSDGTYNQDELVHVEEEASVSVQSENCVKSLTEGKEGLREEPVKVQLPASSNDDDGCKELETEYPSWGDKLCSDSEDEAETLPACGDFLNVSIKSLAQEPVKPNLPQEASDPRLLVPGMTEALLEQTSAGSSIREVTAPVDTTSQAVDTCTAGKLSVVVSDVSSDPRQVDGTQAVETVQTLNQEQMCSSIREHIAPVDTTSHAVDTCTPREVPVLVPAISDPRQVNGRQAVETMQIPYEDQTCVSPEIVCNICSFKDAEDQMLLCDERGCTCAIHTFCLNPPLQIVPTDPWTCLHCSLVSTENKNVSTCSPKRFPPKRIQGVVGRRSNLVKDEQKQSEHVRLEYLVKWDNLSHWHDTWIDAAWFVGERKRYANLFESRHPDLPKIDVTKEIDNTITDERKPEWLFIDRVINCERGGEQLHPSELARLGYERDCVQFLVKWQGLDYRSATWEERKFSKEMGDAISAYMKRHEAAEMEDVSSSLGESVVSSISRQPDYLRGGSMYGYQIQGLRWLLSNFEARRNVILADEMGLGKTVQAIAFISCVRYEKLSRKPVLVVAPKSTLSDWEQELKRWDPRLNAVVYQGEKDNRDVIRRWEFYTSSRRPLFEVLLTSYELATQDNRHLCKFHWAAIIVDEGHRMRNMRSKLGGVLKEHRAEFRLLLTGTPMQNTLAELFSLFHFLDPVEFSNPESAAGEFIGAVKDGNADTADSEAKSKLLSKFHELLRPRMLRRVKTEVPGVSIPGKKIVEVPCSLTPFQRHLYTAVLKKNHKLLNRGVPSGLKRSLNNILTDLKMVCNHPYLFPEKEPQGLKSEEASRMMVDVSGKLLFLEKLLPMLKEGGHRVLLFSQMTRMLDVIEDFLDFMGLSFSRIDGSTSSSDRQKAISDFNRPDCNTFIFLSSTGAGGLGINLPSADTVIIYDPDFNPFVDLQAQARAHRIGQDKIVLVYQLVTEGSVEEKILERSKKKLALENFIMTSGLKGSNETKESAWYISDVILHGLDNILDEHNVKTLTEHTIESVRKLLDRTIPGSSSGAKDDYSYLGAVQGQEYLVPDSHKGYGERWRDLLCRLVEQDEEEELGRGKRTRKQVKYAVEQNVDGQDEAQEDDEYSPTSSSDESSSDVSLEAEGSKLSRKTVHPRLETGKEGGVSSSRDVPDSSLTGSDVTAIGLPSFASPAATPQSDLTQLHRVPIPGSLGTSPSCRHTGSLRSPGFVGVTSRPLMSGSSVISTGLVYERVVSSQGIGIHLNKLIPGARANMSVQAPVPPSTPDINTAVFGGTGLPLGDQPLQFAASYGVAPGISGPLRGENIVQRAGPPSTSGVNNARRGSVGLLGGDKFIQSASQPRRRSMNIRQVGHSGLQGGCNSHQAVGSAPSALSAGHQSVDLRYSASPGGKSAHHTLVAPPASYVPPVSTPWINTAVQGRSVFPSGGRSAQIARPPPVPSNVALSTSCASAGYPGTPANNFVGSLPGMHSPQCSSDVDTVATCPTRITVSAKPLSDIMATNPTQPAASQVPVVGQTMTAASTSSPKPVLSSAGLKKSARNRHRLGSVPRGTQGVEVMKNTSTAAAPVLIALPVVSSSRSQAAEAGSSFPLAEQSTVQLKHSQPLLSVSAPCSVAVLSDRSKETVVSRVDATPVIVSVEASQTVGTTPTVKAAVPFPSPVERAQEEPAQVSSNGTTWGTPLADNSQNAAGDTLPPVLRAQAHRKPLWVPKGDAGLFMGAVRNIRADGQLQRNM